MRPADARALVARLRRLQDPGERHRTGTFVAEVAFTQTVFDDVAPSHPWQAATGVDSYAMYGLGKS